LAFEENRGQARQDVLFLARFPGPNLAIGAQSVSYSPAGINLQFVASNPAPQVRPSTPLAGVASVYSGSNPQNWVRGIPRYSSVQISGVYPGIDVQYVITGNDLLMRLVCLPGCDIKQMILQMPTTLGLTRNPDGSLFAQVERQGSRQWRVQLPPAVYQETASGRAAVSGGYEVLGTNTFGFQVPLYDPALPLYMEIHLGTRSPEAGSSPPPVRDSSGNIYVVARIRDAAGKEPPFPGSSWPGCGVTIDLPLPCTDAALYKFSPAGELVYVSYLSGRTSEAASVLKLARDGSLFIAGATDSSDFPVTGSAYQRTYAGPPATLTQSVSGEVSGDFFAVKLDPATGAPIASTYAGGPDREMPQFTHFGADRSVYLVTTRDVSPRLPVTAGVLKPSCSESPCGAAYAIRLDESLSRAIYATYLPGNTIVTKLHSDGSLYFAGSSEAGFPVTPNAYQREVAGGLDAFVARLNPSGSGLLSGTYFGGPESDGIHVMAVAPDGSVWADITSVSCCDVDSSLIHLDAAGSKLLYSKPFDATDLLVDSDGNVLSLSDERTGVSPDALIAHPCGRLFSKMTPTGEQLYATYLPINVPYQGLISTGPGDSILFRHGGGMAELIPGQPPRAYAGCVVNAAAYSEQNTLSPGEIVTIFGSGMGPRNGVSFQLENGRVPAALAGTRVLVDGQPIPILYASYWQVNAIIPYHLPVGRFSRFQIESDTGSGNELALEPSRTSGLAAFTLDGSGMGPAAALNQDGTLNSPQHPAKPGSVIMLFGTGGGVTNPPSTAGEVTPLELRRIQAGVEVWLPNRFPLRVEFAGAAPGLLSGVTQINVRLPEVVPDTAGHPRSAIPISVSSAGSFPATATIAVE
jgi:uncharacterized protein (TIGR03437 family)